MRLVVPVLLLALTVPLSGCSKAPATDGKIHLKYWAVWNGFELEAMRSVVDLFNRSQDRIHVDLLSISFLERKLLVATAGGNPPDIFSLGYEWVVDYAQKNAILPLDGYLERAGIKREDYIPVFWDQCLFDNRVWGLPINGSCIAFHYNKAHFREAGLDPGNPPKTLAELEAIEPKLNRFSGNRIERLAFIPSSQDPDWWPYCWPWFFGGELWDGKDKLTLTSPECVEAYEWVASFPKRLGAARIQPLRASFGNLFASSQNPFLSGKLSCLFQGSWMASFVEKYAPGLEFGVAPMPTKTLDLYGTTVVEGDVIFIPAGTKDPDASFEFIKFVASQRGTELFCTGMRSVNPRAVRSEEFMRNHPNPNIEQFDALARGDKAHYAPKVSIWYEMLDEMQVVLSQAWLHQIPPARALAKAQDRLQARLEQELERWRLVSQARHAEWDAFIEKSRKGVPLQ